MDARQFQAKIKKDIARNCLTYMLDLIVMLMSRVNRAKGYSLTNSKILSYEAVNFLVRKKSKVLTSILLLQRFKEKFSVQCTLTRINLLTVVVTFLYSTT